MDAVGYTRRQPDRDFPRSEYDSVIKKINTRDSDSITVDEHELEVLWDALATFRFDFRETEHLDVRFRRAEDALVEIDRANQSGVVG